MTKKATTQQPEATSQPEMAAEAPPSTKKKVRAAGAISSAAHVKRVSFDVWASSRGIRESHRRGMKAFTKADSLHTLEQWDNIFKSY